MKTSAPIIPWEGNPTIGWWQDTKQLTMYHGTHTTNIDAIYETGIKAPTEGSTANWVSLAFEPNTAFGYASMYGGEAAFVDGFRGTDSKPKHTMPEERAVFVFKFPNGMLDFNKLGFDENLGGNTPNERDKLIKKELYVQAKEQNMQDQQYYQLTEIRLPKFVDPKYIVGVMFK